MAWLQLLGNFDDEALETNRFWFIFKTAEIVFKFLEHVHASLIKRVQLLDQEKPL